MAEREILERDSERSIGNKAVLVEDSLALPNRDSISTQISHSEQHNLLSVELYAPALGDLALGKRKVLEIGVGEGKLTSGIITLHPESIVGVEIDEGITPESIKQQITFLGADVRALDLSFCADPAVCLIANPPYSLLPYIKSEIIDQFGLKDVQLMVSAKYLSLFSDYQVVMALDGNAFTPTARGMHYVVRKGFDKDEEARSYSEIVDKVRFEIEHPRPGEKLGSNRRIVILASDNPFKRQEFQKNLNRYGIEVVQAPNIASINYQSELLSIQVPGVLIKGIIGEKSTLVTPGSTIQSKLEDLRPVEHLSVLSLLKLKDGIPSLSSYSHRTAGILLLDNKKDVRSSVFGWDDQFLIARCQKTYHEMRERGLKVSSRDMNVAQLLKDEFYYRKRVDFTFEAMNQDETVDFGTPLSNFLSTNPYLSNPVSKEIGLYSAFQSVADNGAFFRSAINRREKNYWLPGLNAGIPLTPKKDYIHQTTFTAHDIGHMLIPDLVVAGTLTPHEQRVYTASRMMSEAITLVLADMLFVWTMKESGIEYDYEKRRIFPLLEATEIDLRRGDVLSALKPLLYANMRYCLRGDDTFYRKLFRNAEQGEGILNAFKEKYMPFFVEDFRWTERNIKNMSSEATPLLDWWNAVKDVADRYDLGLETAQSVALKISSDPDELVDQLFEGIYSGKIVPAFSSQRREVGEDEKRTKAFVRYMLGQMAIFSFFSDMPYSRAYQDLIVGALRKKQGSFSLSEISAIRELYGSYVDRLCEDNRIQSDDAETFKGVFPLFEPFYVFYDEGASFYEDLSTISQRILGG